MNKENLQASQLSEQEVEHIAKLSRLALSKEEISTYASQLSKALNYFQNISEVNTHSVEPMITPIPIESRLREDVVAKEFSSEELLKNAPQKTGHLFTVPPVV